MRHTYSEETVKLLHTLLIACALLLPSGTLYGLDGWMTDLEKAKIQAKEQHKDLFIVYKENSWRPEQYGTPESMFTCRAFKERLNKNFILLIQNYPPGYSGARSMFLFNLKNIRPTWPLSLSDSVKKERQNVPQCVFATADHIPYHVMEQKPSWIYFEAEQEEAKAKREKVLHLVSLTQNVQGEEKYRLMGELFHLANWFPGIPAALYPGMHAEATLHDVDNLSHARYNYLKEMTKASWYLSCLYLALQYLSIPEKKEIPPTIYSNFPVELAQNIRFLNLFLNLQFSLLEGTAPEAPDQLLNENYRKIRQILASAPTTPAARRIRFQSKRIFPRLYHCYKLLPLASQPELLLNSLPGLMEQPWADEESKQLFLLMEAGCHMKMGHLDKGLELLKKARDAAPWLESAAHADASIRSITAKLPTLRELWRKKQAGNEEAAKKYKESTTLRINPATLIF
ncbi:MAG: hypothetical protein V8Q21_11480 [Akkermansia muciniphila]